jgi:hypothetical protein
MWTTRVQETLSSRRLMVWVLTHADKVRWPQ